MGAFDKMLEAAMGGYTHEQLSAAFNLVKDSDNWKNPIDATVPADTDMRAIQTAVIFFAGCVAETWTLPDGRHRVQAEGYYAAVGS